MTDLTQKILSLDTEVTLELNTVNAVSVEVKREADLHAYQLMEEAKQLFEKQKINDEKQLVKSVKEDREQATGDLQKKMEAFDENTEINTLVEHLIMVVKDRICH